MKIDPSDVIEDSYYHMEIQIERQVERAIDHLDKKLLSGELTQEQYDIEVCRIDKWASAQYREI